APQACSGVVGHRIASVLAALGGDHPDVAALKSLISWFAMLPAPTEKGPQHVAARQRQKEEGRQKLVALLAASPAVRAFIEDNVRVFNGKPGDAPSMDQLDALLADQSYRAASWRVAGGAINYRRVFATHQL